MATTHYITVCKYCYAGPIMVSLRTRITFATTVHSHVICRSKTYPRQSPTPLTPAMPVLIAASDSGVVGDDVTNDATPTITGTVATPSHCTTVRSRSARPR